MKILLSRLTLIIGLWLATGPLLAQDHLTLQDTIVDPTYYEQQGDRFKLSQFGASYTLMRDQALTPLRYEGGGITWLRTNYKFGPRVMTRRHFLTSLQVLFNEQTEQVITQNTFEFLPAWHWPVLLSRESIKLYVGGAPGVLVNVKTHPGNVNNVFSYELAITLGPSGIVQLPVRIFGKDVVLSNELQFPLLSLLANTPYAWPLPTTFEEEGRIGDALTVGSWNKYFRVTNQVSVDMRHPVRRRGRTVKEVPYRLAYRWDFVSAAEANLYQSGTHTISIARIINL